MDRKKKTEKQKEPIEGLPEDFFKQFKTVTEIES